MGTFNINIIGVGAHGCERRAKAGDKLHGRCGRINCPDCIAYDFVQRLKQMGVFNYPPGKAEFVHWPGLPEQVVDDMLRNERKAGGF